MALRPSEFRRRKWSHYLRASRDLERYLSQNTDAYDQRCFLSIPEGVMIKLRGRSYYLGHGLEVVTPVGFAAALRRLIVSRVARDLGIPVGAVDLE